MCRTGRIISSPCEHQKAAVGAGDLGTQYAFLFSPKMSRIHASYLEAHHLGIRPGRNAAAYVAATRWLRAGVDVRMVQAWLGHESRATTQKYSEPSKETEKALEKMKMPF